MSDELHPKMQEIRNMAAARDIRRRERQHAMVMEKLDRGEIDERTASMMTDRIWKR